MMGIPEESYSEGQIQATHTAYTYENFLFRISFEVLFLFVHMYVVPTEVRRGGGSPGTEVVEVRLVLGTEPGSSRTAASAHNC